MNIQELILAGLQQKFTGVDKSLKLQDDDLAVCAIDEEFTVKRAFSKNRNNYKLLC